MQAATIKLFLVHGSPGGLRTAELSNWSGKAIAAPRTEISDLLKRDELNSSGVYFLIGSDPESGDRAIYIGEAENVANRLKNHAVKDFWNSAAVFVSKDENLTKAHVRYLEGVLIEKVNNNGSSVVMNSMSSGAKLPESDAAEMDVFLEKCFQLLPVLGITDFNEKINQEGDPEGLFYCKIKGLTATGKRTEGGFVVFEGSQAVLNHRASAVQSKKKRDQLIDKGLLRKNKDHFVFIKDLEFGSPSTAATVVKGGATNGLTAWKDSRGRSLKELELNGN